MLLLLLLLRLLLLLMVLVTMRSLISTWDRGRKTAASRLSPVRREDGFALEKGLV